MTGSAVLEFEGLRVETLDWPLIVMEFPEQRIADTALREALAHIERLMRDAQHTGAKCYQITDLTRIQELPPATQRRYSADWMRRTVPLQRAASLGGANVTPSTVLRGLITAINWFQPPPMPTLYVATRREAIAAAIDALDAAGTHIPQTLRDRLNHA